MKNVYNNDEENSIREINSVFKHLTPEETEKVESERIVNSYKRGTLIYKEGNRATGIYCIHNGVIKIYKTGFDGKEQIIRFAKPSDLIAFRSVLSSEPACTSAKVLEDTTVSFISSDTILYLVRNNGNFALDLLQLTCRELEEANSYLTDVAQKTVRERLAEVLLQLKANFGTDKIGYLQISLTREELANIVGTATESIIRLLSEFKDDRLIELNGRKISLLNIPSLTKIANIQH
jgi:CRP-like cAMP-binding protein